MKTLLTLLAIVVSISVMSQDLQKYLTETKEMVRQKKFQEANERYAWFHNHSLEVNPAMAGVRLSFAISYWKSLADIFPPAMASMIEMRDRKARHLLDSNGSSNLFADIAALNRSFGEEHKTIEVFEKIEKSDRNKAKRCWPYAKGALFNAKRYDIIRNFVGNPLHEFNVIKAQREIAVKALLGKKPDNMRLQDFADNHFVEKSLDLIEFALAVDDIPSAKSIKTEAGKIVKDNRLRDVKLTKGKT